MYVLTLQERALCIKLMGISSNHGSNQNINDCMDDEK